MKIILLINVKIPTNVKCQQLLAFLKKIISRINITSESLKARHVVIVQHFSFYEKVQSCAQLS